MFRFTLRERFSYLNQIPKFFGSKKSSYLFQDTRQRITVLVQSIGFIAWSPNVSDSRHPRFGIISGATDSQKDPINQISYSCLTASWKWGILEILSCTSGSNDPLNGFPRFMPVSMSAAIDSRGITCHSRYSDSGVLSGDSGTTGATVAVSRIRSLVPNDWMRHRPASPVWFKMALLGTGAPLHCADSIRIRFNQFSVFVTKAFVFRFWFSFLSHVDPHRDWNNTLGSWKPYACPKAFGRASEILKQWLIDFSEEWSKNRFSVTKKKTNSVTLHDPQGEIVYHF